jgi:heat shock protein HslJ
MRPRHILFAALAALPCAVMAHAADPLASLAGSEWGFPDAGDAYIQFREKDVSGFSGCNRFFGTYSFVDGALTFGPLVTTRMACPPDKMDTERKILQLLETVKGASATHTVLTLKDGTGATLATLKRRDFD